MFEVQVRNTDRGGRPVTATEAVAVRMPGGAVAEFYRNPANNLIDGLPMLGQLPYNDMHGNMITNVGTQFTLMAPNVGARVTWNSAALVRVTLRGNSPLYNQTCGLCGDLDGAVANDATHVAQMMHWKVNTPMMPSLFSSPKDCEEPQDPGLVTNPCDGLEAEVVAEARRYCLRILDGRYQACARAVNLREHFDNCVFDFCADRDLVCDVFQAVEAECTDAGITAFESVVDECGVCFGHGTGCSPAPTPAPTIPHTGHGIEVPFVGRKDDDLILNSSSTGGVIVNGVDLLMHMHDCCDGNRARRSVDDQVPSTVLQRIDELESQVSSLEMKNNRLAKEAESEIAELRSQNREIMSKLSQLMEALKAKQ
jgi:hypothetical protein